METQTKNKMSEEEVQASKNFLDPAKIFDQLEIEPGGTAADFGCGAGHFSLELARRVLNTGTVYSFDILPQALESIESRAKLEGFQNMIAKRANLEKIGGSTLEDASVDFVVIKDMLFMNKNKKVILEEAARVLKSGGRLLVVEWNEHTDGIGPDESLRVSVEELKSLAKETGLSVERDVDAGDYHHAFVAIK